MNGKSPCLMGKSTINGHFNGIIAGWWWLEPWDFVTFHSVGKNDPNWRTHIFRGVETINQHSYVTFAEATSTSILSGFPLMLREDLQETTFFWIYNHYIISYHYISTIYYIYIYIYITMSLSGVSGFNVLPVRTSRRLPASIPWWRSWETLTWR